MNYKKFSRIYSISRVSRYQKAANGDKKKAMAMYYANARLARAFQPLISCFEVVLRNQLHYALANHFNDVHWLVNQRVQQIRVMRNRISHNEPLCFNDKQYDMAYVNEMYAMIRDFLAWIDPKILASLGKENLDNVLAEIAATEKIMMGV